MAFDPLTMGHDSAPTHDKIKAAYEKGYRDGLMAAAQWHESKQSSYIGAAIHRRRMQQHHARSAKALRDLATQKGNESRDGDG
jgi:hypothetical protein